MEIGNFSWDVPLVFAEDLGIQFEAETHRALLAVAGTAELYDRRARVMSGWTWDLDEDDARCWGITANHVYRLRPWQWEVLARFAHGPLTPRALLGGRSGAKAWSRREIERLLSLALCRRFLEPAPTLSASGRAKEKARRTRGVLIVATGEPYLWLASGLAASIKARAPQLRIALVHGRGEQRRARAMNHGSPLFDEWIERDMETFSPGGRFSPFLLKTHLDRLTPFDATLYLDADSLIFPEHDLGEHLESVAGCDLAPAASGYFPPSMEDAVIHFLPLGLLKELFPLRRRVLRVSSYYLYFRAHPRVSEFFELSRQAFLRAMAEPRFPRYRGSIPDEPIFAAATGATRSALRIHAPIYMPLAERAVLGNVVDLARLRRKHLGMTMVGEPDPVGFERAYDQIAREVALIRGSGPAYLWRGKG